MPEVSQSLKERVDELRGKLPLDELAYESSAEAGRKLSGSALSKILNGQRPYNAQLLVALAKRLGVEPSDWPEYELALAREQLDEHVVGLDTAAANLRRVRDGLIGASAQAQKPPIAKAVSGETARERVPAPRGRSRGRGGSRSPAQGGSAAP